MPSIAVADDTGEIVVGVIRDPHRGETYAAVRGGGATLDGKAVRCRAPPPPPPGVAAADAGGGGGGDDGGGGEEGDVPLGDAIVAMGSPPASESMAMSLAALPFLMPRVRTVRMLGSAALMLAWVADGRLTAYWEYDLR